MSYGSGQASSDRLLAAIYLLPVALWQLVWCSLREAGSGTFSFRRKEKEKSFRAPDGARRAC
jgi:hypothetical protein